MKPWGTPALTGYSCKDFPSRTTRSRLLLRKEEIRPISALKFHKTKFMKKTSMPNPVKSIGYVKCHSSSILRLVKSPSNSIRYNCEKISSWSRRPKKHFSCKKHFWFSRYSTFNFFPSLFFYLLAIALEDDQR